MSDVFQGRDYGTCWRDIENGDLAGTFLGKGLVFLHLNRFDIGERIIMPGDFRCGR